MRYCLTKDVCDRVQGGMHPREACEAALSKVLSSERFDHLVAVFCVDADFNVGGASTTDGFQFEYVTSEDREPVIVTPKPVSV
jgi:isoaspartyl peptidase/L-asparaginase-like protein (Ntn-hydrolase superfamily)